MQIWHGVNSVHRYCCHLAKCRTERSAVVCFFLHGLGHSLMPSSHRLSCLILSVSAEWTELATSQDCRRLKISKLNMFSFLQFCPVWKCSANCMSCLVSTQFPFCNCSVSNILRTMAYWKLSWLVGSSVHTADMDKTIDKTVLSCLCRWCEIGITRNSVRWQWRHLL